MPQARARIPGLSPALLAGLLLRPLPVALLQPAVDAAFAQLRHRHPGLFDRLGEQAERSILVAPADLPFRFLLRPDPAAPMLRLLGPGDEPEAAATVRGPLALLIDLLEGRIDGDALFFSREIVIEGDTEAIVALRNAVDGAGIDLVADLFAPLGPLAPPAAGLARLVRWAAARQSTSMAQCPGLHAC